MCHHQIGVTKLEAPFFCINSNSIGKGEKKKKKKKNSLVGFTTERDVKIRYANEETHTHTRTREGPFILGYLFVPV